MTASRREMRLNLFLVPAGHHEGAWRHPETNADQLMQFDHYRRIAQKAEQAKFDSLFMPIVIPSPKKA